MAVMFRWQGDGLTPGTLTTTSAGPGDTAPSLITANTATATIISTSSRSPAIQLQESGAGASCLVDWTPATSDTAALRLYFTPKSALATTHAIFSVRSDSKERIADIILTSAGAVRVYDVDNAFQSIGGSGTIVVDTTYRFELVVDTQVGTLSIAVYNGHSTTPLVSQTNVTGNFIASEVGCVRLGKNTTSPTAETQVWDDIVLTSDNTFVGPAVIVSTISAGPDQIQIEPFSTVSLTGSILTGSISTWSWNQTSGQAVSLNGNGASRTFVAPASTSAQTLTFEATGDGTATDTVTVEVNPHLEWIKTAGGLSALRPGDS